MTAKNKLAIAMRIFSIVLVLLAGALLVVVSNFTISFVFEGEHVIGTWAMWPMWVTSLVWLALLCFMWFSKEDLNPEGRVIVTAVIAVSVVGSVTPFLTPIAVFFNTFLALVLFGAMIWSVKEACRMYPFETFVQPSTAAS